MKSSKLPVTPLRTVRRMPMELHHLNDEVPGSSPGGSNMWGHSSMVEHEVSSKPCRRAFIVATKDTEGSVKDTYEP